MNVPDVVNSLYHGGVVGGITVVYSMVLRKVLKIQPANLTKLDVEDSIKLAGTVGTALMTQSWLIKQGVLPATIMPKPI